jgi:hypothetical protein
MSTAPERTFLDVLAATYVALAVAAYTCPFAMIIAYLAGIR